MAIEIVDLPIDSMVISHSYVSLPEGYEVMKNYPCGKDINCLIVLCMMYIVRRNQPVNFGWVVATSFIFLRFQWAYPLLPAKN